MLSGGLDSATVAAMALRDGFRVSALSFDYGQRHRVELEAAAAVARSLAIDDHRTVTVDLRAIGGSALTDDIAVPKASTHAPDPSSAALTTLADPSGEAAIPITYVPARNSIFLAIALGLAEAVGARDLYFGANALDYSGYPDCRPAFVEAFEKLANVATKAGVGGDRFRIHAPLMHLTKAEIIRRGVELGVDYALTHSCYDPGPTGLACGRCESCRLRRRGFVEARVPDPTRYQSSVSG